MEKLYLPEGGMGSSSGVLAAFRSVEKRLNELIDKVEALEAAEPAAKPAAKNISGKK